MEYVLHGVPLVVEEEANGDLTVMEGLHYMMCEDTGQVHVLSTIFVTAQWLGGYDFHNGRETIFPMTDHSFCARPGEKKLHPGMVSHETFSKFANSCGYNLLHSKPGNSYTMNENVFIQAFFAGPIRRISMRSLIQERIRQLEEDLHGS